MEIIDFCDAANEWGSVVPIPAHEAERMIMLADQRRVADLEHRPQDDAQERTSGHRRLSSTDPMGSLHIETQSLQDNNHNYAVSFGPTIQSSCKADLDSISEAESWDPMNLERVDTQVIGRSLGNGNSWLRIVTQLRRLDAHYDGRILFGE